MSKGLFVTGTDTGVGKTVVTAAILAALKAEGLSVAAFKPVVTGTDEPADSGWPYDHELLAAAAGSTPSAVTPLTFGPATSPHLAASLTGTDIQPQKLTEQARSAGEASDILVVEGVGGLMVPLTTTYSIMDFAQALKLPLLVVARPSLGTINHTLLTVAAAKAAGLAVKAVILNPWPKKPTHLEQSNLATLTELTGTEVHTFPQVARPETALLAAAGRSLPLSKWL